LNRTPRVSVKSTDDFFKKSAGSHLFPGKYRLFKMINTFVDPTFNADPAQLQQDSTSWRMDEVATQWNLYDGTVTFRN
jgi:hypothetical protein